MTSHQPTAGNPEYNNYLYFAFDGEVFDTDTVTKALRLEPTSVRIKNDPVPKSTSCEYRINAGMDIDLETHLEKLVDIFESKADDIKKLNELLQLNTRLQFVIWIDINPDLSLPYFGLNKRTIDFLCKTGSEVDFGLYTADTLRLLDK